MQLVSSFYIRHVSHSKREETREARSVTHTIVYIYIYIYTILYIYTINILHIYHIFVYSIYIYTFIYIYIYQLFHFDLVDSCRRCLLVMVNECATVVKDSDVQPALT